MIEILLETEEENAVCTACVGGDSGKGGERKGKSKGERIFVGKHEV